MRVSGLAHTTPRYGPTLVRGRVGVRGSGLARTTPRYGPTLVRGRVRVRVSGLAHTTPRYGPTLVRGRVGVRVRGLPAQPHGTTDPIHALPSDHPFHTPQRCGAHHSLLTLCYLQGRVWSMGYSFSPECYLITTPHRASCGAAPSSEGWLRPARGRVCSWWRTRYGQTGCCPRRRRLTGGMARRPRGARGARGVKGAKALCRAAPWRLPRGAPSSHWVRHSKYSHSK